MVEAQHGQTANRLVVVVRRELVEQCPHVVDQPRMVARKQLERDQGRTAAGRALVLEPAP